MIIEDCAFLFSRNMALEVNYSDNFTMKNTKINDNGILGAGIGFVSNMIMDRVETNRNNWIGEPNGYRGWSSCGIKIGFSYDTLITNYSAIGNQASGLWLDRDNIDMVIKNAVIKHNMSYGAYIEAKVGPVYLENSQIVENFNGVYNSATDYLAIDSCIIANNERSQIIVYDHKGEGRGIKDTDGISYKTGTRWNSHAVNTTIKNSSIMASPYNLYPLITANFDDNNSLFTWIDTLTEGTDNNTYWHPAPEQAFFYRNELIGITGWKEITGSLKEANSKWAEGPIPFEIDPDESIYYAVDGVQKEGRAKKGTPKIDGEIDEIWSQTQELNADRWVSQRDYSSQPTAKVRALWDDEYLYILAEVMDNTPDAINPAPYEQDSIEIFLNQDNRRYRSYLADDGQYRINYMGEQSGSALTDILLSSQTKRINGGYLVEAAIGLNAIDPHEGTVLGFDFQINDAVNGSRKNILAWNDTSNMGWQSTEKYGYLILENEINTVTPQKLAPGIGESKIQIQKSELAIGESTTFSFEGKLNNGIALSPSNSIIVYTTDRKDALAVRGYEATVKRINVGAAHLIAQVTYDGNAFYARIPVYDSKNLAENKKVTTSSVKDNLGGYRGAQAVDVNGSTYWNSHPNADTRGAGEWIDVELGMTYIDSITVMYAVDDNRITKSPISVTVQVSKDGVKWEYIVRKYMDIPQSGILYSSDKITNIPVKRNAQYVRLLFEDGTADISGEIAIAEILVNGKELIESVIVQGNNMIDIGESTRISTIAMLPGWIVSDLSNADIAYRTDRPGILEINGVDGTVKRICSGNANLFVDITENGYTATGTLYFPQEKASYMDLRKNPVKASRSEAPAKNAVDGNYTNPSTNYWGTPPDSENACAGDWWQVDLLQEQYINDVRIWYYTNGKYRYIPVNITYQVSDDGLSWRTVRKKMDNVPGNGAVSNAGDQFIYPLFEKARYLRLLFEDGVYKGGYYRIRLAEIQVNGVPYKTVELDQTPPVTVIDADGYTGDNKFNNKNVTVAFTAVDGAFGSGLMETKYRINEEAWLTVAESAYIESEGRNNIEYYSVDIAGNVEKTQSVIINIDKTPPVINTTVGMTVYQTETVRLDFEIADSFSGVANYAIELDGSPISNGDEIAPLQLALGDHIIIVTATDYAGNKTEKMFNLKIIMNVEQLDEFLIMGFDRGCFTNEGILNSLMSKVRHMQNEKTDYNTRINLLKALRNEIEAQDGKKISQEYVKNLFDCISYIEDSMK